MGPPLSVIKVVNYYGQKYNAYKQYNLSPTNVILTFLNCIQGDHATMHMKELPIFTYNLWMGCLHRNLSCQLLCPVIKIAMSNNFKHSDVHFTHFLW